jgi:hypothetical protein
MKINNGERTGMSMTTLEEQANMAKVQWQLTADVHVAG